MEMYEIRTIQEGVPYWDPDDLEQEDCEEYSPEIITNTICKCDSEEWARKIAEFVRTEIARANDYAMGCYTPEVRVYKIEQTETELEGV